MKTVRTKQISIYLKKDDYEEIKEYSEKIDEPMSRLIYKVLKDHFKNIKLEDGETQN